MLSRGDSNASSNLRRAKSTSSARTNVPPLDPQSLDPELARRQALTAANIAFERAHDRVFGSSGADSSMTKGGKDETGVMEDGDEALHRRQSVRFTGPTAGPSLQRSITRRQAPTITVDPASRLQIPPYTQTQRSSSPHGSLSSATATSKSNDSSSRKIRKSRSVFNTRKTPPMVLRRRGSNAEGPQEQGNRRFSSSSDCKVHTSTKSQGTVFVCRPNDKGIPTLQQPEYTHDAAIQLARDEYLRQLEEQRLRERPSFLSLNNNRSQKSFRRTVRTNSTNGYGNAIASPMSLPLTKPKGIGTKARDISISLKNKLKRMFQKEQTSDPVFPNQQINSQRQHFGDQINLTSKSDRGPQSIPVPGHELLHRVNSRPVSPLRMPVHLDQADSPGSIRSISGSDHPSFSASRVTSWANSTAANTLSKQELTEKQRLSIIQENGGPYQPSSIANSRAGIAARNGYALFRRPLHRNNDSDKTNAPINSQRVFSALQKRLNGQNHSKQPDVRTQHNTSAPQEKEHEKEQDYFGDYPRDVTQISRTPTPTNRGITRPFENGLTGDARIRGSKSSNFENLPIGYGNNVFRSSSAGSANRNPVPGGADRLRDLTPQQIADLNEKSKKPLREVKSAFFPSTTDYQSAIISPFRRALLSSDEDEKSEIQRRKKRHRHTVQLLQPSGKPYQSSKSVKAGFQVGSTTGSESAYSRTTSGRTPRPFDTPRPYESTTSLARSESSVEPGVALIHTDDPTNLSRSNRPAIRRRMSLSEPSGEWKEWMATQVSNLEVPSSSDIQLSKPYAGKENAHRKGKGHKRENAQIHGDDTDIGLSRPLISAPKQPLGNLQKSATPRPQLMHKTSDQMFEKYPLRFPLIERPASRTDKQTRQVSTKTKDSSESLKQTVSNAENLRVPSQRHRQTSTLRPSASYASLGVQEAHQLRSVMDNEKLQRPQLRESRSMGNSRTSLKMSPSTNSGSRYSPERQARLRRRRSNTTLDWKENMGNPSQLHPLRSNRPENQGMNETRSSFSAEDLSGARGTSLLYPVTTRQQVEGTKKLVDLFLNSRRTSIQMSEEHSAPAFI
ncbi:MAG: hypothetical protein Q9187_006148 [Circinaria calcarea]